MNNELAEQLLEELMGWDVDRFTEEVPRLQALAAHKYDEYGQYRPGVKFAESLAVWLEQFEPDERETAMGFVLARLIFISSAEVTHLIDVAYPDVLEPVLLERTAADVGESTHRVKSLSERPEFLALRRRMLVLGLSDGAQLDRLRRASPLSHEQFRQEAEPTVEQVERMGEQLAKALKEQSLPGEPTFREIVLVDDFAGSGRTLLREDSEGGNGFTGKLWRFRATYARLAEIGVLADDARILILLYCASEQAIEHLRGALEQSGLGDWSLKVIQRVPESLRVNVTDPAMAALCTTYYDPTTEDVHKGATPLGFSNCALPLVLAHNAPNNSVCLLWAETDPDNGLGRRALFPRYERHHPERP